MKIKVSNKAKYSGQDMEWTEVMETKITTSDMVIFHCSDNKINMFVPKQTCFFKNEELAIGHVYRMTIPAGTIVETDGSEVRVNLIEGKTVDYLGCFKLVATGETKRTYSNYEGWIEKEIVGRKKIA